MTSTTATCPSCSTCTSSIVLTSIISVSLTAVLATVVFVLVQIAVCKCHPKSPPGGAESAASAGGEGQPVYEQVDVVERGVAVSGLTEKGNALELNDDIAYGTL